MTISRHAASVIVDGVRHHPVDMSLALDESSVPYARLTANVPYRGETVGLDPRNPKRVTASMRQDFGDADTLAAISARHVGNPLGELAIGDRPTTDWPFEDGLGDWQAGDPVYPGEYPSSLVWSSEQAHSGTHSMELVSTGSNHWAAAHIDSVPFEPGYPIMIGAWFHGRTDYASGWLIGTVEIWLDFLDADGEAIASAVTPRKTIPDGEWTYVVIASDAPPISYFGLSAAVRPMITVRVDEEHNDRVWVDDVRMGVARKSLTDITNTYGRPYNSFGMRASTHRRANLYLRSRDIDHASGTVTIEATSGEAMLSDYSLAETSPVSPGGNTVRDAVNLVLGRVLNTAVSTPDTGSEVVEPDALPWEPGENAWSYLTSITGMAGLRLWCDEVGLWHLRNPETWIAPGGVSMGPDRATVLQDSMSRENEGFGDSAVVTYEWTDSNGERRVRHDAFGPGGDKTLTRTVQRPYPGRGFAQAIARKGLAQGRVVRLSGVSDYDIQPLQSALLTLPDATDQAGVVSSVQWSMPSDEMNIRTRDLMGITTDSWLFTVPGRSWNDTPTGVSWNDYDWGSLDG